MNQKLLNLPPVKFALGQFHKLPPLAQQIVRFAITGGGNTVFGYVVYALLILIFDLSYQVALVVSYIFGIIFSFLTFRAFVFTEGERGVKGFMRFVPTYIFLLLLNMLMLHGLVDLLGWHRLVAQALAAPVCAILSFIINRLFVFRGKKPE